MKTIKRIYTYNTTYNEVMEFAKEKELILTSPNKKNNFPYFLEEYIAHLKWVAGLK